MACGWANVNILPGLLVSLNKAPQADHPCGQLLVVHGLVLHRFPAHLGLSYLSFLEHSYSHHPKGSVMGSGQALEALHLWIYSSYCRAPSFTSLCPASHWWTLQSLCSFSFLQVACSSYSCCLIQSRVAWAASFSCLWATTLIHMLHISRASGIVVSLWGV